MINSNGKITVEFNLKGKKIILGVTGSIAAYKAVSLLRLLQKEGAEVQVILTEAASKFVTSLTFSTISQQPVFSDLWSETTGNFDWSKHVQIANQADLILIAPCTLNTIAKFANGICNDSLLAVCMAAKCPKMIAPAMDGEMWDSPPNQRNIKTLIQDGIIVLEPEKGYLASGLEGQGRMQEPEAILNEVISFFSPKFLANKNVLITAGPTLELIDPVRYISNFSTGKMGVEIAKAAKLAGANVDLVLGPSSQLVPKNINTIRVKSAEEMYNKVHECVENADIIIMSAAVCDYKPENVVTHKIKKSNEEFIITLQKTKDILESVGKIKKDNQILVGFALETQNEIEYAKTKITKKNLDFIVVNTTQDEGAAFGHDTNKITIIDKFHTITSFELKSKKAVANDILHHILNIN